MRFAGKECEVIELLVDGVFTYYAIPGSLDHVSDIPWIQEMMEQAINIMKDPVVQSANLQIGPHFGTATRS